MSEYSDDDVMAADREAQLGNPYFDYTVDNTDTGVLQNLAKMGEHLKELKLNMLRAETLFDEAKKEYDYYASTVLPMAMFSAGVSEVTLMSGGKIAYERKFYCTPNKNDADKAIMAEWLRKQDGGFLIKEQLKVPGSKVEELKAACIPYTEIADINTNSLKAFLVDKIGGKGGIAQIQVSDIPPCIHFQEVGAVSIEV